MSKFSQQRFIDFACVIFILCSLRWMLIALGSPSVNPNWESNPRYVTATGLELEHFSLSSKKFSLLHIFKKFQILTVFKILDVWNIDFVFDFKRIFDVYGKFWLLMQDIQIHSSAVLSVRPRETSKSSLYYVLQMLKKELPSVMIKVHQATSFRFISCSLEIE